MEKLRALVLDIETAPIIAMVWDTRDQNIAVNQIVKDWYIMAFSAKWLGGKTIHYFNAKTVGGEKKLLKQLWHFMDMADIIVGQNSKAFDTKKITARFIYYGMKPPMQYKHLDTYLIAKNAGAFTKNSLEYLTQHLKCKHHKSAHSKFPGMSLWAECLSGNNLAWAEMKKYNMNDVRVTEELYEKLKAWAPKNSPAVYLQGCKSCGSTMAKNGVRAGVQLLRCKACGSASSLRLPKAA